MRRGSRGSAGGTGSGKGSAALHVLQRRLHGGSMGIDAVRHHGPVGSRQGTWARASAWCSGCSAIGSRRIAIGSTDAIGGGLSSLRLSLGVGMATETGALEQVLLLTRGVFGADLLAVDTLDGETLYQTSCHVSIAVLGRRVEILRKIQRHAPYRLPWRGTRRTPRELPGRRYDPCSRQKD